MSVVESVKKGFSVAAGSMSLVLVLFAFGFVWNIINIFAFPETQDPTPQQSVLMVITAVIFILLSILVQGGSLGYVRDRLKQGSASLSALVSAGGRYYLRMLAIGLIIAAIVGVFVLGAALILASLGEAQRIVAVVLAVLLITIAVVCTLFLFLAPYIIVSDEEKAIESLKRSVSAVKANFGRILGIFLILVLVGFGIGVVSGLVFALINLAGENTATQLIFAAISSFVNAFLGVVVSGAFMSFYLSLSSKQTAA